MRKLMTIAADIAAAMMRRVATTATIVRTGTTSPIMAMTGAIAATTPIIADTIAATNAATATSGAIRSAGCTTTIAGVTGAGEPAGTLAPG